MLNALSKRGNLVTIIFDIQGFCFTSIFLVGTLVGSAVHQLKMIVDSGAKEKAF
jgi:hypothetical protein